MKAFRHLIFLLLLIVGCQKPFPKNSETAFGQIKKSKISVVFIAGYDVGDNTYYANSKSYFEGKGMHVVDSLFSVDEIIDWMNGYTTRDGHSGIAGSTVGQVDVSGSADAIANKKSDGRTEFDEIHIVSHGNPWSGMSLKTTKLGERITLKKLRDARNAKSISTVKQGITNTTKIIFHSCGLGENQDLLQELKNTFTAISSPIIYATPYFSVFGGKFAAHYLAKPYYGFHPTAESPGPRQLAEEFEATYTDTQMDWYTALKTRHEGTLGKAYTYKFNVPVDWEFTFENPGDIPKLADREAIMDWVAESPEMAARLLDLNIPLEKYRWSSETAVKTLRIKGKTTILCVLAPILQEDDTKEYRTPAVEDKQLYQIL